MKMENKSFSGIIITYNEEGRISQCINSLNPFCSEILVVDSFSTDKTIELAKKLGAKVIQNEFNSHVKQKNFAIENAKNDWIISIDADEIIQVKKGYDLINKFNYNDKNKIYKLKRKNFYLGIWIEETSWKRDSSVRIFNRKKTNFVGSWVHDEINENNCDVIKLNEVFILHWPYRNLSHHLNKINKYTDHLSFEMYQKNKKFKMYNLILNPLFKFFKDYFLYGGWKLGVRGLILSINSTFYVFLKYSKLWEKWEVDEKK